MRYERFIDRVDKTKLIEECSDFKPRLHGMPSKWTIYAFVLVLLSVVILIIHMSIRLILLPYSTPTPLFEIFGFLITTTALIVGLAIFSSIIVNRVRHYITETEFQSLLFASSLATNCEFYLIANKSRIAVYYDYNFAENFPIPEDNPDALRALIKHDGIKSDDRAAITKAVTNCERAEVPISLKTHQGKTKNLKLVVNPLKRPAGYSIIKGISV